MSAEKMAASGARSWHRHNRDWLEHALSHEYDVGTFLTYTAFLRRTARRRPDSIALICEDRTLTYQQVFKAVSVRAGCLVSKYGIVSGSHVALLMDNSELYQIWYLAVLSIGAVAIPLNTRLSTREFEYQVSNSGAVCIIRQKKYIDVLKGINLSFVDADDTIAPEQPEWDIEAAEVRSDSPAAIYYTSGTTGNPKGVVHTHRSLIAGTVQGPRAWEYDDSTAVTLAMTPLFHIANHTWFLPILHCGGTMVIDTYSTSRIMGLIDQWHITHIFAVPTMLLMMMQNFDEYGGDYSYVRSVAFGAAPMPSEKLADVHRLFPNAALVHGMGQTESCGTVVTLPSALAFEKAGSVGVALDGVQIKIVNDEGDDTPTMVVGELLASGPNIMSHYHNQPEATEQTLINGWLRTGDVGYLDKDGFLFLVDRKKDLIIRGGENIYSTEVENVLYMHPGVAQAAVVAGKSPLFGEEVVAFVVRRVPEDPSLNCDSLRAHCALHLAGYKVPAEIIFLPDLPQTATGKIQKHVLRAHLPEKFH